MVTYFNKKDLVKFGKFILSDERTERIKQNYDNEDGIPFKERLQEVYHADVCNFLDSNKKDS